LFGSYKSAFSFVGHDCELKDIKLLKTLAANIFSKWYGAKVESSIRIVPIE
jgi:hypothetical protein